ncbi:MAG: hypothetical protein EKK48_12410 [Candidatus Melainabacteria bacterium]|nr:MAG: hypothetical protein EKK48_12410 [Candidatus Melainabacteria bacterium]
MQLRDRHDEAEDLANEFPFNVPELPPRTNDPKSQYNQIVKYVVIDMKEVYELLQGRYTESESRIVQKAAKMGMLRFNYEPGSEIGDYALKILLKDYGGGLEASSIFYDLQKALEAKKSRAEILKALDHTDKLGTDVNSYMLNMKMPPSVRMKFKKSEASSVSGNTNEANVSSSRREGSSNKVWSSFGGLSGKPTPIAQPPGGKTISTRADKLALWDMGSFIGAAALLSQSPDVPLSKAAQFYAWAEDIARKFQLQIAPLPARTGSVTKDTMASLTWATQGQYPLWNNLENKYGETERLDVELATKSQMLLLVYEQSGSGRMVCEEISKSFKENGEAAFPPRIWKPLTDAIDRKASKDEIKRRVADLDAAVRAWYDPSKPAPRN